MITRDVRSPYCKVLGISPNLGLTQNEEDPDAVVLRERVTVIIR